MGTKTLNKTISDKISFCMFIIIEFAEAYKMNKQKAFNYLQKYGGLDFIYSYWWELHTDNSYYSIKTIFDVCKSNGGYMR